MFNYTAIMDLFKNIGVFPISPQLSLTNIVKGYILLYVLYWFFKANFLFSDVYLGALSFFLPHSLIYSITSVISQVFWKAMVFFINKRKIKIIISGVNLRDRETLENLRNCVVISNHRSLFDHILIHYLKTLVENVLNDPIDLSFFSWNMFWNVPGFRLIYQICSNDESWEMSSVRLNKVLQSINSSSKNNWVCHFPEGNMYTEENRLIQSQQWEKYYIPKFSHLLYPRFSNFNNLITSIQADDSSPIKTIIDLSIVYFNPIKNAFDCPTLFEIFTLKQPLFIVHVDLKVRPIGKLPYKERKLEKWLEADWVEKEKILQAIQKQLQIEE